MLVTASLVLLAGACSGDDDDEAGSATSTPTSELPDGGLDDDDDGPRFCDTYLTYLGDASPANLAVVVDAADDGAVSDLAAIITDDPNTARVLSATDDLDRLARDRCQTEWTAGAQGAGSTAAAAQAFFDALVAGDAVGARNVASANAIATFAPWEPIAADPATGTPAVGQVTETGFTLVLDADTLALCEVEIGVVVTCQRT